MLLLLVKLMLSITGSLQRKLCMIAWGFKFVSRSISVVFTFLINVFNIIVATSTPNASSDSVEGLGGQSSDRDWLVGFLLRTYLIRSTCTLLLRQPNLNVWFLKHLFQVKLTCYPGPFDPVLLGQGYLLIVCQQQNCL